MGEGFAKEKKGGAVLFIHGILGTPRHFEPFLPLVPAGWAVTNLRLKGHGGSARDFSAASMDKWKLQVRRAADRLRTEHGSVVIAAHSMGALLAIREAAERPVAALFLLNVPLKLRITAGMLRNLRGVFSERVCKDDAWARAARDACGTKLGGNIFHYAGWIPRFLELFAEMRRAERLIPQIDAPCAAYVALKDELLSVRTGELLAKNPRISVRVLAGSGHYYYSPEDTLLLRKDFSEMLQ